MYLIQPNLPLSPLLRTPLFESWPPPGSGGGLFENNSTAGGGDPGSDPASNWSSLIGIVTAIVGNVLIALALNVQRYAHTRLHRQRQQNRERARQALKDAAGGANGQSDGGREERRPGGPGGVENVRGSGANKGYGTLEGPLRPRASSGKGSRDGVCYRDGDNDDDDENNDNNNDDDRDAHESDPLAASYQSGDSRWSDGPLSDARRRSDRAAGAARPSTSYLRSPYWWLGQVLITVGEMGNFLAYGFAPASIVSPLGVVALISNCVIAPILFKEVFRVRDFGGLVIAIAGAVTVVLSAKQEETKLNPHDVWDAITTTAFEIYVLVTCGLIALLMWASPRYGNRTILIDLGLVGLYGAYTVLATKGVSSMLSSTLFGAFITPMTYVLIVILLGTAVMQVRYVNKALQRFDSTQVIPIQFVLFTLSVIVGSAVLYRDFERTTAEQAVKFVGGCLLTFSGVFLITSGRPPADVEDDSDDNDDDMSIPDAINLLEQARNTVNNDDENSNNNNNNNGSTSGIINGVGTPRTPGASRRSSRTSRASRVSFADAVHNRPLFPVATDPNVPSTPVPTRWMPPPPSPIAQHRDSGDWAGDEDGGGGSSGCNGGNEPPSQPLLANPWHGPTLHSTPAREGTLPGSSIVTSPSPSPSTPATVRPNLGPSAFSADSVLHALHSSGTGPTAASSPAADRPVTPATVVRSSPHGAAAPYIRQGHLFSPSPLLSSTVSTVVADTILKHMEGAAGGGGGGSGGAGSGSGSSPQTARRLSTRRVRPTLRASLFVPQDELLLDDAERLLLPFSTGHHHYASPRPRHHPPPSHAPATPRSRQEQRQQQQTHHRGSSTNALVTATGFPHASGDGPTEDGAPSSAASTTAAADHGTTTDHDGGGGLSSETQNNGLRGRARSLSAALGGFFWPTRRPPAADPEDGAVGAADGNTNHDDSNRNSQGHGADYTANDDILPPAGAPANQPPDDEPF
ncbi:DUF803 domain protein membrane protein [Niveomyces insectorum RCEF 264]|uniref:DUF803 domain protein membrane protein n=1 Tax=Niveomyces insectorum RCEF 264 TaxID=1081102 RepID=A0A167NI83_9HYPO|nr:DUF803 domain protein membrane protein [Niveomyces insectorum RCEF 264]